MSAMSLSLLTFGTVMFAAPRLNVSICISYKCAMTQFAALVVGGSHASYDRKSNWLPPRGDCSRDLEHMLGKGKLVSFWTPPSPAVTCEYNSWRRFYEVASSVLSVHVVREPLERLVSGYLDRCVHLHQCSEMKTMGVPRNRSKYAAAGAQWPKTLASFARWVGVLRALQHRRQDDCVSDDQHFRLQACDCARHGQFNWTIAWSSFDDAGSLSEQAIALCTHLRYPPNLQALCHSSFPPRSRTHHRTNATTDDLLNVSVVLGHATLLADIHELYRRDFATWRRAERSRSTHKTHHSSDSQR